VGLVTGDGVEIRALRADAGLDAAFAANAYLLDGF